VTGVEIARSTASGAEGMAQRELPASADSSSNAYHSFRPAIIRTLGANVTGLTIYQLERMLGADTDGPIDGSVEFDAFSLLTQGLILSQGNPERLVLTGLGEKLFRLYGNLAAVQTTET